MAKPILVSGVQPTGRLHIGNYLGALKNFVELQDSGKYDCYFFVADLHSLTENFDPKEKAKQIMDVVLTFLAVGIDPNKSKIFIQSQTSEPAELAWILNTITPMGELERMTQFKDKSGSQKENVNAGLFTYPILMAADILLYNASFVPVGDDQLQHLEFTRTIARKFNSKFGKTFVEPKPVMTSTPRLMSLDKPGKKMSKSQPSGCLFMDDSAEVIREKVMRAVTDSGKEVKYDEKNKPAISSLMDVYKEMSGDTIKSIEKKFEGKGYGVFKAELAELIVEKLAPIAQKKQELKKSKNEVNLIIRNGAEKAKAQASKKLAEVKKKVGLI